jgi:hypothetical protein
MQSPRHLCQIIRKKFPKLKGMKLVKAIRAAFNKKYHFLPLSISRSIRPTVGIAHTGARKKGSGRCSFRKAGSKLVVLA